MYGAAGVLNDELFDMADGARESEVVLFGDPVNNDVLHLLRDVAEVRVLGRAYLE